MALGGKREGAGRKKGVPNKSTIARLEAERASGLMPLDYMLQVLRDETEDKRRREWAANASAPYLHSRLATTEHTGKDGGPIIISWK